ncbi:MAG TPA: hypothetical protein VH724_08780 [Candidatus Angelobacter sp.]|nr:hypothetical protein [Candidatus Angelobacter sp.]
MTTSCASLSDPSPLPFRARRVVAAVPVGAKPGITRLHAIADQVICMVEPKLFFSVSHWYENFEPVADGEICQILDGLLEQEPQIA